MTTRGTRFHNPEAAGRDPRTPGALLCALGGICLLSLLSLAPATADWAGREEVRDGIRHVLNPATPAEGTREIELRELWTLGDPEDEEAEL
ncbi:MAG: hypothetical protein GF330_07580, partial [Candidatus Eisenbacteria bacterium]|nr:hypothetical protein [Candidatus Eisenbacteria bacterium]